MNRPGDSRSLAARTARTGSGDGERIDRLRRRHCWVLGAEPDPGPWPGLVAEWRRSGTVWQARVIYVLGDGATTREEWLPAARLRRGTWPG